MKNIQWHSLLLEIIFSLSIFGCNAEPPISPPQQPEVKPTLTRPVTYTPAPTRTSTSTPTPSITPTATPDIMALGDPSAPTPQFPSELPRGFYTYSNSDSYVYEKVLHERPVTVVFAKDSILTEAERQELSDYIFSTFLSFWEIFGGYRTQRLLIRIGPQYDTKGATSVGFGCTEQWLVEEKATQGDWYQPLSHEMFHAWMGTTIMYASYGGVWFTEGSTQYFGDRLASRARYLHSMNFYNDWYRSQIGTKADVPLVAAGQFRRTGTLEQKWFYYRKGALVLYLIDQEMIEQGYSLDDLMREMYLNFGLTRKSLRTGDVQVELEKITGQDWQAFFDAYVYGTEPLPLDSVSFLEH